MEPINVTASDNGAKITPAPGQTVVIRLPENPTTGYSWQILQGTALSGANFSAAAAEAAGAAGERVFTVVAGESPATLRFGLSRPWESDAPEQQFTLHIAPAR